MISYIKGRLNNDNKIDEKNASAVIEIANHSWRHENFSKLTMDEMTDSIRKTNEKIENIFGITPTVFIAPFNEFDNNIFVALHENNISYFSASERNDPPPYSIYSNTSIYHLPQTGFTGNCNICGEGVKNASWYSVKHEKTLDQINRSLSKYGFAVVTLHAWEYSLGHDEWIFNNKIDVKQIRELRLLLNEIQKEGLKIVPISKIVDKMI